MTVLLETFVCYHAIELYCSPFDVLWSIGNEIDLYGQIIELSVLDVKKKHSLLAILLQHHFPRSLFSNHVEKDIGGARVLEAVALHVRLGFPEF